MDIYAKIRSKLLRKLTALKRELRYLTGLDASFYKNARGSRILIYHGICQRDHTRFNPIFLTERLFEGHLKLYQKYCNVVLVDDLYNGRLSNDKFNVCLTFDDGYANNHKYVLPLLAKYKMPATFFITGIANESYDVLWNDVMGIVSKYGPQNLEYKGKHYYKSRYGNYFGIEDKVDLREKLRATGFEAKAEMMEKLQKFVPFKANEDDKDYWLQMTEKQIAELAASPYAHIGAHGYYHNDLARIDPANAFNELVNVKQYLEGLINKPVNSIAFPYGSYNQQVIDAAKKAGYDQLLAVAFRNEADALDDCLRERFTVNPFLSPVGQLYATIKGSYDHY